MSWLGTHWKRLLALANGAVFLVLLGVALWISFAPQGAPTSGGSARTAPSPAPASAFETPDFTVAPPYTTSPVLTGRQALLSGRVLDSVSGAPLAGAQLDFKQAGGPLSVHTDANGAYQAVIDTAQPFGFTINARAHAGGAAFGKLCPGDRRDLTVPLTPAGGAPTSPIAIQGSAC